MNTLINYRWLGGAFLLLSAVAVSYEVCRDQSPTPGGGPSMLPSLEAVARADEPAKPDEAKRNEIGKNVFLEKQGDARRVVINSSVCLREGVLEGLLTLKGTKEHEYILVSEADARHIHAALLLAGATPGSPVQYEPKYSPACGSAIKVFLRYKDGEKLVTVPAQKWIRDNKTKKDLDHDWVFGGSKLVQVPEKKQPIYLANQGDVICLCNMPDAMLDLPVKSPKSIDDRIWETNVDRIPAMGTAVEIILEVVPDKKDDKK
jgi:hypothetical protein